MEIKVEKVKQYNSTYKHVVMVNGKPVCITDSSKRASLIVAYLTGYAVDINDGSVEKVLVEIRRGGATE